MWDVLISVTYPVNASCTDTVITHSVDSADAQEQVEHVSRNTSVGSGNVFLTQKQAGSREEITGKRFLLLTPSTNRKYTF